MNKIRLGIVGYGNIGRTHGKYLLNGEIEGMELTAVSAESEKSIAAAREELPENVKVFQGAKVLMDSGEVDAVLITAPHYSHAELTVMAFEKGLHVMCEKPSGVYTKQARIMNEASDKSGKAFGMMFNQRTNHVYRKMHELVNSGEFGELRRVNWIITNWYRPQYYYDCVSWRGTWEKDGGGVLLNQSPHQLDLLQWICGMPAKVQAHCHEGKWHDIEVEDDVTAYLEYPNGATGVFVTSTGDCPGTNRFEITMEKGKLICEDNALTVYKLDVDEKEYKAPSKECFSKPAGHYVEVETDGLNLQHKGVMQAFASHILNQTPLVADGREGINELMLSNAMYLSSWLNQEVALPIDEELFLAKLQEKISACKHRQ